MKLFKNIGNHLRAMSRIQQITLLILLLVGIGALIATLGNEVETNEEKAVSRVVTVASIGTLSESTSVIPLSGSVTSINEATIRSEASGQIRLHKRLGDFVTAGQVIGEFDNAGERAAVLQAEGAYDAARVGVRRAQTGTEINTLGMTQAEAALREARSAALNVVTTAYATLDDAIRAKTDAVYSNPEQRVIRFVPQSAESQKIPQLESTRSELGVILTDRKLMNETLTINSDLETELTRVTNELQKTKSYLDDMLIVLNRAIPDSVNTTAQIEIYKGLANAARGSVSGQISAVIGATNALQAAKTSRSIAEKQTKNDANGQSDEVLQAEAGTKQALGVLRAAQARLEKTIIRAPLSGTINALPVDNGDFVAMFSEIAVVANNGALEVVSYVTEEEAAYIQPGTRVAIDGAMIGVVSRIAPALDPRTKKIEVRIALTERNSAVTNGASVRIEIPRTVTAAVGVPQRIPLAAVKFTPQGALVFTVSASSTLVAHPVVLGTFLGEYTQLSEALDPSLAIVTDARGLKEGMEVTVQPAQN